MNKTWRFLLEALALVALIAACCYGAGLALGAPDGAAERLRSQSSRVPGAASPEIMPTHRVVQADTVLEPAQPHRQGLEGSGSQLTREQVDHSAPRIAAGMEAQHAAGIEAQHAAGIAAQHGSPGDR